MPRFAGCAPVRARRTDRRRRGISQRGHPEAAARATRPGKTWSPMRSAWFARSRCMRCSTAAQRCARWQRVARAGWSRSRCIAIFVAPIVRMARAYVHRNGQFPVLADFHSRIELYWIVSYRRQSRDRRRRARGGIRAQTNFPASPSTSPCPTGGVTRPWSSTSRTRTAQPLQARRARARSSCTTARSTTASTAVSNWRAGERRNLRIPLEDIRHGARNRLMDMAHISDITLFRGRAAGLATACVSTPCGWSNALPLNIGCCRRGN